MLFLNKTLNIKYQTSYSVISLEHSVSVGFFFPPNHTQQTVSTNIRYKIYSNHQENTNERKKCKIVYNSVRYASFNTGAPQDARPQRKCMWKREIGFDIYKKLYCLLDRNFVINNRILMPVCKV